MNTETKITRQPERRAHAGPVAQQEINRLNVKLVEAQAEIKRLEALNTRTETALDAQRIENGALIRKLAARDAGDIAELGAGIQRTAWEQVAALAVEWGNARVDDGGGNALRNFAEEVRARACALKPAPAAVQGAATDAQKSVVGERITNEIYQMLCYVKTWFGTALLLIPKSIVWRENALKVEQELYELLQRNFGVQLNEVQAKRLGYEWPAEPAAGVQVAPAEKLMADMDTLRDEYTSLSTALAFWLPNVPDEAGPIQDRIVHDVFFLGEHGEDKSAQDLGWITLAAAPALSERTPNLTESWDRFNTLRNELRTPGYCDGTARTEREAFDLAVASLVGKNND